LFQAEKETRVFLKSSINKYYAAKEKDAVTLMWDYIMANVCTANSKTSHHRALKQGISFIEEVLVHKIF
jgi:hypothetical protein